VNGRVLLAAAIVSCSSVSVFGAQTTGHVSDGILPRSGLFVPAPGPPSSHSGRKVDNYISSENWAGYVQATTAQGTFTQVTDTFVVPTVDTSIKGTQDVADWVGIGGIVEYDKSLVQAGIESDNQHGHVSYAAWTETLPHPEDPLRMTILPGDTVTITVQEMAKNRWLMQVQDGAQIGSRTVRYRSSGESVEAIHERPCIRGSCNAPRDFATLAQTSNVTFIPGFFSTTPAGQVPVETPLLVPGMFEGLVTVIMQGPRSDDFAAPSLPDAANDGFTVADNTIPPPPNT
jgi:hypothetical protein